MADDAAASGGRPSLGKRRCGLRAPYRGLETGQPDVSYLLYTSRSDLCTVALRPSPSPKVALRLGEGCLRKAVRVSPYLLIIVIRMSLFPRLPFRPHLLRSPFIARVSFAEAVIRMNG